MREKLADAIEREVAMRDITTVEIKPYMPAIRNADLRVIKAGFGACFGSTKLLQIAEAIGLEPTLSIRGVSA